jgi:hypothetical protein
LGQSQRLYCSPKSRTERCSTEHRAVALRVGDVIPAPEPQAYLLMLMGLGAMGFIARRRRY